MRRFVGVPRNLPLRNGRVKFGELEPGRERGVARLAKECAKRHVWDHGMSRHLESDVETNNAAKRMR